MEVFSAPFIVRKQTGRGRPRKQANIGVTLSEAIKLPYVIKPEKNNAVEASIQQYSHFRIPADSHRYQQQQQINQIHRALLASAEAGRDRRIFQEAALASEELASIQGLASNGEYARLRTAERAAVASEQERNRLFKQELRKYLDPRIDEDALFATPLPFTEITNVSIALCNELFCVSN
ncbi:hypothetical protein GL50803_005859 [Giardia duodenalis]|uniref:Uncharacterized protein n=1 Tax=Giardia intestinalis (strain ATCC 50803 / WB clone C6) TaxID=184922 RepID=A8B4D2_GIAIC|nr:hypothetical protein GL50803_005859 [Giardia intestinalis]KAE8303664.1 hypothetical protein GL50803_005859 [Giardia intestinalis]|eukprot:XP_001709563.1 Hypothetical protein GL50803_5859 [Giardia lamblia ATCC 50803]